MGAVEYFLLVGVYGDRGSAAADLRDITNPGPLAPAGAALVVRDLGGCQVHQLGGGTLAYSITAGAAAGVATGGLLGVPVRMMALGAVVGAFVGRRASARLGEEVLGELGDVLPAGTTGLIAVADARLMDDSHAALGRALRTTGRVLDRGPLMHVARTLARGKPAVTEWLDTRDLARDS